MGWFVRVSPRLVPACRQAGASVRVVKMKIIYFLKNIRLSQAGISFVKRQTAKIRRLLKKEKEALVEVELIKDKEVKAKEGVYKTKIILDLPRKSLIVAQGVGKNLFQALNDSLKKLKRQLRRKP